MLTYKQSQLIEIFWKVGYFTADDLRMVYSSETSKRGCILRLMKLGIIEESNLKFKINRERFLEIQ